MKLEYKILWLDDKIKDFIEDGFIEEVEEHLLDNNFIPIIIPVSKTEDFFKELDSSFDLILTDYHLNNDENGEKVINELRRNSVMTEVLFYTAKADLTDAKKIDRVSFLETGRKVGTEHIENVIAKTIDLIDLTIKKFQHIVSMRGMIMQETSSLDVEMEIILKKLISKSDNPDDIISTIIQKYIKSNEEFSAGIKDLTIENLENISFKIGASHRWRALKRNLPKGTIKTILNDYESEIISIRNKFAHAVLKVDDSGREYFENRKEGIDFNEEFCNRIRKNIIKHKENLEKLSIELDK